ncbi:MAG: VWA domain-containing protein, partial [Cytophagales bacterium]|nr:VWA domain-containing protein [Cytophagales bacterium]
MNRFQLTTSASPWFILLCLAVGAAYAYILYQKRPVWGPRLNWALAACRFLVASTLCFLLLGPLVRQWTRSYEKPAVVLAVDNSQSVTLTGDSTALNRQMNQLHELTEELRRR